MTLGVVNILWNRTKSDANGLTEMVHLNKLHVLHCDCEEDKKNKASPTKHSATMNSIRRNNDGHQKGSLKCKIQQDVAHSICRYAFVRNHTFHHNSPHQTSLYPAGVRLTAATSLCLLCTPSRVNEPSVNFSVSQSKDQSQAGLSCQPLAAFQLDFTVSFPPGRLLVA